MVKSKDIFLKFILNFRLFFANIVFTLTNNSAPPPSYFLTFCLDTVQNNLYKSYITVDLLSGR